MKSNNKQSPNKFLSNEVATDKLIQVNQHQ